MSIIEIEDLWIKFRRAKEYSLKGINLKIEEGEAVGIIGPTGAGKSTLCITMNALIPRMIKVDEFKGNVTVKGLNTQEHKTADYTEYVGIVFQDYESQLFRTTVELEVAFGPENLMLPREEIVKRIEEALSWVRLEGLEQRFTYTLSGGQKQRLAIASVLSMYPEIIIFDEATSDLDPVGKFEIYSIIEELKKKKKITLIMVDHHLDRIAEIASRVIVMNKGEIIYDAAPQKIFSKVDELIELGLRPPQVCELFNRINSKESPLTAQEAIEKMPANYYVKKPVYEMLNMSKNVPVIEVNDVAHYYEKDNWVLENINLTINRNDFVGIIGQNGSGKTTLVQTFNGINKPKKGDVKILGESIKDKSVGDLGKFVAYVFQNPDYQIFSNTVREEIGFGPKNLGLGEEEINSRVQEVIEMLEIQGLEEEDPFFLNKANRQRVAVASVLALEPEIIILDEPTTGLSPGEVIGIMKLVKKFNEQGKTIILITHDLWVVAEYCKRAIVLHEGKIVYDGSVRETFSQTELLKSCSLEPPQITRFGQEKYNVTVLSVDDLLENLDIQE